MTDPDFYPINPDEELNPDNSPGQLFVNRKNRFLQIGEEEGLPEVGKVEAEGPATPLLPSQSFVTDIDAEGNTVVYAITSGDTYTCSQSQSTFFGLLDYFGGATVALSLRRLSGSYTGPLIRVRRDIDGEEQDIGYNEQGQLDTAALSAFVPSGDGFVTRWYNQAAPGEYYEEGIDGATPKPPRIVSSGSIVSDGSILPYPAIEFPGSRWLEGSTLFTLDKNLSTYLVGSADILFGGGPVYDNGANLTYGGSYNMSFTFFGTVDAYQQDLNDSVSTDLLGGGVQTQLAYNGNDSNVQNLYRQGVLVATQTSTPGSRSAAALSVIGRDYQYNFLDGKIQEIIAYPKARESNFFPITSFQNEFFQIYSEFTTGLLDDYGGAAAAYSLRRLSSSYGGPAVRVRRASDNQEEDIGFDIHGNLNVQFLKSFCSGTDGFVKIWYDQAGSNDAEQTDPANQPTIFTSGAVVTENGKPAVEFNGSVTDLSIGGSLQVTTVFTVTKADTNARSTIIGGGGSTFLRTDNTVIDLADFSALELSGQTIGSYNLIYGLYDGANSELGNLGGTPATGNAGSGNYSDFHIGSKADVNIHSGTMQEIVLYDDNQKSNRTDIETNINDYYEVYEPFTTGLLDEYGGAAAAYSLRRLSSTYTGPAIAVRKDGDPYGTTQDIGFDIQGNLDVIALTTYCGASDGFVEVWYDQSGNTNDAEQTTTGSQPRIYDSSTGVVTENGKPVVHLSNTQKLRADISAIAQPITTFSVRKYNDTTQTAEIALGFGTAGGGPYADVNVSNQFRINFGSFLGSFGENTNQGLWYFLANGANSEVALDGSLTTGNAGTSGTSVIVIGGATDSQFNADVNAQEIVIYDSNQSTNRTGIETNINDYYQIY